MNFLNSCFNHLQVVHILSLVMQKEIYGHFKIRSGFGATSCATPQKIPRSAPPTPPGYPPYPSRLLANVRDVIEFI